MIELIESIFKIIFIAGMALWTLTRIDRLEKRCSDLEIKMEIDRLLAKQKQ